MVTQGFVWHFQVINNSACSGIWLFSLKDVIFIAGWWLKSMRSMPAVHSTIERVRCCFCTPADAQGEIREMRQVDRQISRQR